MSKTPRPLPCASMPRIHPAVSRPHARILLFLLLCFSLLLAGCTVGLKPIPNPNNLSVGQPSNSSAPPQGNSSFNSSAALLEANRLFLSQTQAAEEASARMNFSEASRLFNLSSQTAANLTRLLFEVCGERGRNCSGQLAGYAQIAACSAERAGFYAQVQLLLPAAGDELRCRQAYNSSSEYPADCLLAEGQYNQSCSSLFAQAQRTYVSCRPVMPGINVMDSARLLCPPAENSSG